MPSTRPPSPRRAWPAGVGAVLLAVALVSGLPSLAAPAAAERATGFHAELLGRTAWYGTHQIEGVGPVWALDSEGRAPRRSHRYVSAPADDVGAFPPVVRRALAWAAATPGATDDPVAAAAVGLVLHDLTGARYPAGPLDLQRLGPGDLEGFDGAGPAIVEWARSVRADALSRALLEPPFTLAVDWRPGAGAGGTGAPTAAPGGAGHEGSAGQDPGHTGEAGAAVRAVAGESGDALVRLTDANGLGLAGVVVHVHVGHGDDAGHTGVPASVTTRADGTAAVPLDLPEGVTRIQATTAVPDALALLVPTRRPAQRVARPAVVPLAAGLELHAAPATGAIAVSLEWPGAAVPAGRSVVLLRAAAGPGDAEELLDRRPAGQEPVLFDDLAPGTYLVGLAPPGAGRGIRMAVTVEAGGTTPVTLHPGAPGHGRRPDHSRRTGDPDDAGAPGGETGTSDHPGDTTGADHTAGDEPTATSDDTTGAEHAAGDEPTGTPDGTTGTTTPDDTGSDARETADHAGGGTDSTTQQREAGDQTGGTADSSAGDEAAGTQDDTAGTGVGGVRPDGGGDAEAGGEPGGHASVAPVPGDPAANGGRPARSVDASPTYATHPVATSGGKAGPVLPVTGSGTLRLALAGIGLVLLGDALRLVAGLPSISPRGSRRSREPAAPR